MSLKRFVYSVYKYERWLMYMKIEEFRGLSEIERVDKVNERLKELKEQGLGTKQFKSEKLEFSYATAIKEMELIGYGRNGNRFEKELKLTEHELILLKNLAYNHEFVMSQKQEQPKVKVRPDDQATTTSIRMYNQVWKRWQAFSQEWPIYNSIDLMASALEEFMDRHDFEDFETLMKQGKIKDNEKK